MKNIESILRDQNAARLLLTAFQNILDTTDAMVFVKDRDLVYHAASMPFVRMVGKTRLDEVIGKTDHEIFEDPTLARRYRADDQALLAAGENRLNYIEPLAEEDGHAHYGSTSKYVLWNEAGEPIGVAGLSRDITREYRVRQSHQQELEYLFSLPEDAYFTVFVDVTGWRIIGERRQAIGGYEFPVHDDIESLSQRAFHTVADRRGPAHAFYRDFTPQALNAIYESGKRDLVMEYLRCMKDGTVHWVRDELKFLMDPSNGHLCLMLIVRDIDQRKQAEQDLLRLAERDELTGLLNRAMTMKYIRAFLSGSGADSLHALLVIDLDNFKSVNDTYGHQAGDRFLAELAGVIRGCFRESDVVGRIGGDEFFVLIKHTPTRAIVEEKGEELRRAIRAVCNRSVGRDVSASIGVSMYRSDGATLDLLYERADEALYAAKRQGKDRLVFAEDLERE